MVRLFVVFIVILFFFIIYYIIKTLFRENQKLRSSKKAQTRGNSYNNIEEADFKEIEPGSNKKNDKDVQE
jgi:hypothetical protein